VAEDTNTTGSTTQKRKQWDACVGEMVTTVINFTMQKLMGFKFAILVSLQVKNSTHFGRLIF